MGDTRRQILDAFASSHRGVRFVQIGSCDGVTGDPIHEYIVQGQWSGVVVEPVGYAFTRLCETYAGNERVACEHAAISQRDGTRVFWHLRQTDDDLPYWYEQIGSFDRDHLLKHAVFIPEIERYITQTRVPCLSLSTLLARHGLRHVDLFHTDVEGFDFEIIKQIDFEVCSPDLILYEDLHMTPADRSACESLLTGHGYRILRLGMDNAAVAGAWSRDLA